MAQLTFNSRRRSRILEMLRLSQLDAWVDGRSAVRGFGRALSGSRQPVVGFERGRLARGFSRPPEDRRAKSGGGPIRASPQLVGAGAIGNPCRSDRDEGSSGGRKSEIRKTIWLHFHCLCKREKSGRDAQYFERAHAE